MVKTRSRTARKQRQGPCDADTQEDRDVRRAILRVEAIITGAERIIVDEQKLIAASPIDLEELYE